MKNTALMFENTRDAILLLRLDGEIIDMNAAMENYLKITNTPKNTLNF